MFKYTDSVFSAIYLFLPIFATMKNLLLLVALFTGGICHAQNATSFAQKRCDLITDGSASWSGVKIKIAVPCEWKEEKAKDEGTKEYAYDAGDAAIMERISIRPQKQPITEERMNSIINAKDFKKAHEKDGMSFFWGRRLKVDGVDCIELASKTKKKVLMMTAYVYTVQYMFPYKDKQVTVSFACMGEDKDALKALNDYKALFLNLAMATKFLN